MGQVSNNIILGERWAEESITGQLSEVLEFHENFSLGMISLGVLSSKSLCREIFCQLLVCQFFPSRKVLGISLVAQFRFYTFSARGSGSISGQRTKNPYAAGCGQRYNGSFCLSLWFVRAESCSSLCDPVDYSLPDSSVHGVLQAKILEWVAIPFSRGFSQPRDQTHISHISCIGRWILYNCITREGPCLSLWGINS